MSMNYAAASATVIEDGKLKELFPIEHGALQKALDEAGHSLDSAAFDLKVGELDCEDGPVWKAIEALYKAFETKYRGLTLELCFHNQEDDGDRYDEVSGAFWDLGGVYVLSDAAKQLGKENFRPASYVVLG